MTDILSYGFMQNALAAALLASLACGVVGSLVMVNRLTFLAGGVAHTAYGGVGLSVFLGWPLMPVTLGFTTAAALLLGRLTYGRDERTDTLIGAMWAAGMALGVILVDLTPGYRADLMSYLFGSLLAVPTAELGLMAAVAAALAGFTLATYKALCLMALDRDFARARGAPVLALHLALVVGVALAVVLCIRVVGLILVMALITLAPAMAERHARSMGALMVLSTLCNCLFCLGGLGLSYYADISSGAAIIAVGATAFGLHALACNLRRRTHGH